MQVEFWAKTTVDEQPGISVFEHMKNVGLVARALASVAPELLRRFQMEVAGVQFTRRGRVRSFPPPAANQRDRGR